MWSLGVILLEVLLGQPIWIKQPFEVKTCGHLIALRAKIRKSTVVASSKGLTRKNSFKCDIGVFGVKEEKPKNVTPVYSND